MVEIKKFLKKVLEKIIDFIISFSKIDDKRITIYSRGYSGSNSMAFKKSIYYGKLTEKYDVLFINMSKNINFKENIVKKLRRIIYEKKFVYTSKIVISTHGSMKINKKSISLDLWHGIPLKTMNLMDKNEKNKRYLNNIDYLATDSDFNSTLLNACFGIKAENYIKIGNPRNDLILESDGNKNISDLFNTDFMKFKKIFLFPTYRSRKDSKDGNYNYSNIFGFRKFNYKDFDKFLEKNEIKLFLKLHPNDEKEEIGKINKLKLNNLFVITEENLSAKDIDLYETLNSCDLLITDYSSIYFDYLILNRPIIFNPVDITEYSETRGFLLNPYDFWTPGPKVYTQEELETEIIRCISDNKIFSEERKLIRDMFYEKNIMNSSEKLFLFTDKIMNGGIL